ncbi:MAG: hypothetical protein U1D31_01365 [Patescibacteria group bacterium]|nr:hypothetical protein [bacterium]MDZ4240757.1 hypothetical protein [Patescibacteria group bacterium]
MKFLESLTEEKVEEFYLKAGSRFGEVVSYIYSKVGDLPENFGKMLKKFNSIFETWELFERQYVELGYKACDLEALIEYGACNSPFYGNLRIKRKEGEAPVYYAQKYKEKFLEAIRSGIDFSKGVLTKPRGTLSFPYLPEALK